MARGNYGTSPRIPVSGGVPVFTPSPGGQSSLAFGRTGAHTGSYLGGMFGPRSGGGFGGVPPFAAAARGGARGGLGQGGGGPLDLQSSGSFNANVPGGNLYGPAGGPVGLPPFLRQLLGI